MSTPDNSPSGYNGDNAAATPSSPNHASANNDEELISIFKRLVASKSKHHKRYKTLFVSPEVNVDFVLKQLEQREKDVVQAVELGQMLLVRSQSLEQARDQLQGQVHLLMDDISALQKDQRSKDDLQREIKALQNRVAEMNNLKLVNMNLLERVDTLEHEKTAISSENSRLSAKIDALKRELETVRCENDDLREQVSALTLSARTHEMKLHHLQQHGERQQQQHQLDAQHVCASTSIPDQSTTNEMAQFHQEHIQMLKSQHKTALDRLTAENIHMHRQIDVISSEQTILLRQCQEQARRLQIQSGQLLRTRNLPRKMAQIRHQFDSLQPLFINQGIQWREAMHTFSEHYARLVTAMNAEHEKLIVDLGISKFLVTQLTYEKLELELLLSAKYPT